MEKKYIKIVEHYENCLRKHGDNHLGVDWPKADDSLLRYKIMLDIIPTQENCSLLDFGCGTAELLSFIQKNGYQNITYSGLDLSYDYIQLCKKKFPSNIFFLGDVIETPDLIGKFDYIVLNGVFTEKCDLSFDEMYGFFRILIKILFEKTNRAIAFNVMSKHVDWERDDLFHLPFDMLAKFLKQEVSRNFIIRNDYGLFEYTVYVLK